jgi:hypothetical protein
MLTVDVTLYVKELGGRKAPIEDIGYGCACKVWRDDQAGCECRINFYNKYPVVPGETRRADIFFLTGDDAESRFQALGKFYLCEDGIIGEAKAVPVRRCRPGLA